MRLHTIGLIGIAALALSGAGARAEQSIRRRLEHHPEAPDSRRLLARGQGRGRQARGGLPEPRRQPGAGPGRQDLRATS